MILKSPTKEPIKLDVINPNIGVELAYRRKLQVLINEMAHEYIYWVRKELRDAPMAQDAAPNRSLLIRTLQTLFKNLGQQWVSRFNKIAPELAQVFVNGATQHTDNAMMASLKKAGFTIKFSMSPAVSNAWYATLADNVSLIKSIPAQFHKEIEGIVWRGVSGGFDLEQMTKDMQSRYDVTFHRAAFIAKDQSNKAKAVIENERRKELGITQAIWQHSHAGREPRKSHVKAGRENLIFDLDKGAYLEANGKDNWAWQLPGQSINCRCTSRAIIPGFDD